MRASHGGDKDGHYANMARVRWECHWNGRQCAEMTTKNENANIAGAIFSTVDLFSRPNSCVGVPTDNRREQNHRQSEARLAAKWVQLKILATVLGINGNLSEQLKASKKNTVCHNLRLAVSKKRRRRKKGPATFWQSALVPSFPPTPPPSGARGILIGPLLNCNFFNCLETLCSL